MFKYLLDNIWLILISAAVGGLIVALVVSTKTFKTITDDTLKINGKYSRTSLTMLTAWLTALWSYHYDIVKNGFDYQAFCVIVAVALGSKVTDAWSKKLNPEIK